MNAGELTDKISILSLSSAVNGTSTVFTWAGQKTIWAKAEQLDLPHVSYNRMGKLVRFLVRKTELSPANAIHWNNQFCMLTCVSEIGRQYLEVIASLTEPVTCGVVSYSSSLDQLNRPVLTQSKSMAFPGILAKKAGHETTYEQRKPMAEVTERKLLFAPKQVTLQPGTIVEAGGKRYTVTAMDDLDPYRNEYEILRKGDA